MFNFLKKSDGNGASNEGNAPKTRKRKGYFLELDDAARAEQTAVPSEPAPAVAPVVTTPPVAEVKQVAETLSAPAEAPTSEAPKRVKKFRGQAPEQVVEVPTQTANGVKAEPMKVTTPAASSGPKTFATDFLLPKPGQTPRRRPGANMASYLDMARQMQK